LKALQTIPINLEVLQKTRIGMTVNNLRKSITDEDVISLSKSLIKSWKKLLSEKDSKPDTDSNKTNTINNINNKIDSQKSNSINDPNKSKVSNANQKTPTSNTNNNKSNNNNNNNNNNNPPPFRQTSFPADTSNSVRLKCRELLAAALKPDDSFDADETFYDPEDLAAKIEEQVFKEFKDTNMKYKNRIRSRVSNLNDKKNPDLKLNVLRGSIKPEKIAVMTAEV